MRNCTRETLALAREELAKYVINNMHPVYQITDWANEPVNKWINGNKDVILKLQSAAIYEQAHHEAQQISKESLKKIKKVMDYFKKYAK